MKKLFLIIPVLAIILTGCSVEIREKHRWCEDHGGRMFNRGFSGVECVFPPDNLKTN